MRLAASDTGGTLRTHRRIRRQLIRARVRGGEIARRRRIVCRAAATSNGVRMGRHFILRQRVRFRARGLTEWMAVVEVNRRSTS